MKGNKSRYAAAREMLPEFSITGSFLFKFDFFFEIFVTHYSINGLEDQLIIEEKKVCREFEQDEWGESIMDIQYSRHFIEIKHPESPLYANGVKLLWRFEDAIGIAL